MLPFIVAGLTIGSAYALAGVGLVLSYKTSGLFNFAHGAIGTLSAYLFYFLYVEHGWPWPVAVGCCLLVAAPVLGLLLELVARRLDGSSLALRVVSTIGLLLMIQGTVVLIYGSSENRSVPKYLPTDRIEIGGLSVAADQLVVMAVAAAATVGLYVYLRATRMGTAMRAVVADPVLLSLSGTSPAAVRRTAWIIGVIFSSMSGVLLVPFIFLDATTLTFLVVAAFGAAAIGQFTNLPLTYVGGLVLGVGSALATKYFTTGLLSGLSVTLPFLVLFLVLMVSPRGRLAELAPVSPRASSAWRAPWLFQSVAGAALLVALVFVPSFAGFHLTDWSRFLAMTVVFLSLGLLVRTSGQVSLCHVSFMAIGACSFSQLHVQHGWPWAVAFIAAGLIAMPIGALLAIPAIRLSGLYLALATFGFGLLVQYMFYTQDYMFGALGLGASVPAPDLSAIGVEPSLESYYYLCLAVAVVMTLVVVGLGSGRLGRLLRALADSPNALSSCGVATGLTCTLVFCLSAFMAALGGVLEAGAIGVATEPSYAPMTSLLLFALIVISVGGAPWHAVVAALGATIIPSYWTDPAATSWLQLAFGLSALGFAMLPSQAPPAWLRTPIDRWFRLRPGRRRAPSRAGAAADPSRGGASLGLDGVRVSFGGLVAVDDVSLAAPAGKITGLIGPNGAGKTTMFNVSSGFLRPTAGCILLAEDNITRAGVARRARAGLGRTFQRMELFDSLTVKENVALGYEGRLAGFNPLGHVFSRHGVKTATAVAAASAMEVCDIAHLADETPGSLSTGQRRLVELARCLAGPFRMLLLDEPSSGLDRHETARFGEILQQVVRERDIGILLVEHDMALVTEVCDYIYVLDFGRLVYEGAPPDVMASTVVRNAYLGDDLTAPDRRESEQQPVGPSAAAANREGEL